MLCRCLFLVTAVTLATLGAASTARGWGAFHAGYTHVGPGGVYHYGRTAAFGPYGGYAGARFGAYGGYGGYGYEARRGNMTYLGYHPYAYGLSPYYGYRYGGLGYDRFGDYRAGFYRRW
jgi:hypothetical protein